MAANPVDMNLRLRKQSSLRKPHTCRGRGDSSILFGVPFRRGLSPNDDMQYKQCYGFVTVSK